MKEYHYTSSRALCELAEAAAMRRKQVVEKWLHGELKKHVTTPFDFSGLSLVRIDEGPETRYQLMRNYDCVAEMKLDWRFE